MMLVYQPHSRSTSRSLSHVYCRMFFVKTVNNEKPLTFFAIKLHSRFWTGSKIGLLNALTGSLKFIMGLVFRVALFFSHYHSCFFYFLFIGLFITLKHWCNFFPNIKIMVRWLSNRLKKMWPELKMSSHILQIISN